MRITNQMLNESARKAGLPVNHMSLLNYVNNTDSGNSLLNALNKSGSAENTVKKTGYEKLEKMAENLLQSAEIFTEEGEETIFSKAEESGDKQEIYDKVQTFVENYNSTLSALKNTSSALNQYYYQMMQEAAEENSEKLGSIGITISKNGTVALDKDKLTAADMDTLEQTLGASSDFSKKVAFLALRVSDNARANAESLSSRYSAKGDIYSAMSNKYEFWG